MIFLEDPRAAIKAAKKRIKKSATATPFDRRLARQIKEIDELSSRLQKRAKLKDSLAFEHPNGIFIPYSTVKHFHPADFELWIDDKELIIAFEHFGLDPHNSWSWRLALQLFCQSYFAADGSPKTWNPKALAELKYAADFVRSTMVVEASTGKSVKKGSAPTVAAVIRRLRLQFKDLYGDFSVKRLRELLDNMTSGRLGLDMSHYKELTRNSNRGIKPKLIAVKKRKKRIPR